MLLALLCLLGLDYRFAPRVVVRTVAGFETLVFKTSIAPPRLVFVSLAVLVQLFTLQSPIFQPLLLIFADQDEKV